MTKYNHEKILIVVALVLCAGILFYNAFYVPEISIPSVIYLDSDSSVANPSDAQDTSDENSQEMLPEINSNKEKSESASVNSGKININTATETELSENLNGVGTVTAKKIVEYRETIGKFKSIDEIKNVSGIGEKTFEKFKNMICI